MGDELEDRIALLLWTQFGVEDSREAAREIMKLVEEERKDDYRSTVLDMETRRDSDGSA